MPYVLLIETDGWVILVYLGHPLGKFGDICNCVPDTEFPVQAPAMGLDFCVAFLDSWI